MSSEAQTRPAQAAGPQVPLLARVRPAKTRLRFFQAAARAGGRVNGRGIPPSVAPGIVAAVVHLAGELRRFG
eukprot:11201819-Lingulodinium_polyedra.AAC.1